MSSYTMTVHGPGSILPDDEIVCEGHTEAKARREFAELTATLPEGVDAFLRAADWSKLAERKALS